MTTPHTSGAADPEALQSVTYFTAAEGAFGEACANAAPSTRIGEIVWLDGRPDEVLLNDLHICVAVTNAGKMLVGYSRTNRAAALDAALAAEQAVAPAIDASPSAASIAWNALRDLTDPLGELGARIMGHARIFAQRQYEAGRDEVRPAPPAMDGGDEGLIEALELGLECAIEVAANFHEAYKGHRPHDHAAVDADVEKIKTVLAAARAAQKEIL